METPFCFGVFWGVKFKKSIFASRQPNHVKHLLSGLYDLLNNNFHSLRSPPGDPRVAHCSHFSVRILPLISFVSTLTGIGARGPQGRSDTALRPDSNLLAPYATWFPAILTITLNSCANVILRRLRREEVAGSWGRARARATVDSRVGSKHHAQQRRFGS